MSTHLLLQAGSRERSPTIADAHELSGNETESWEYTEQLAIDDDHTLAQEDSDKVQCYLH